MKNKISTIFLLMVFFAGLSLLLYPLVSDYWNSFHVSQVVSSYAEDVKKMDEDQYKQMWEEAAAYNNSLNKTKGVHLTEEEKSRYNNLLNIGGTGVMGYIEIPNIKISLPIYHGKDDSVLQTAVGHLEWTSLPVRGESTHCVISGHRGLPSAKLFTNLDQLAEGDTFVMRIMDEILTYEVDTIRIIEPTDVAALQIEEGKDLCTLMTCTPYGVNSHRLLVRGHRIENESDSIRVSSDAVQVDPLLTACVAALPMLLALLVLLIVSDTKKKTDRGEKYAK